MNLDSDNNGTVDMHDLVQAFGTVAHSIDTAYGEVGKVTRAISLKAGAVTVAVTGILGTANTLGMSHVYSDYVAAWVNVALGIVAAVAGFTALYPHVTPAVLAKGPVSADGQALAPVDALLSQVLALVRAGQVHPATVEPASAGALDSDVSTIGRHEAQNG